MNISDMTHPDYDANVELWKKWRLVYKGGKDFIDTYLKKFSNREDATDFSTRKEITYCPAHAKSTVNEVKNSIFQRMVDVSRVGGPKSYQNKIQGLNGGVDQESKNMNTFIGTDVLPDLLSIGKVGVYVDMPNNVGLTLKDSKGKEPYLYKYKAEDILSWTYESRNNVKVLTTLLLRDTVDVIDESTGLTTGTEYNYRLYRLMDNYVTVQFYNDDEDEDGELLTLDIPAIPFVIFSLTQSLLVDVDNYQVALLNMESSDVNYSLKSNFPFYTEQYDNRATSIHLKPTFSKNTDTGENTTLGASKSNEVQVGESKGRRYPKDTERPGFIHPSSEPLKASMDKEEKIKLDIRTLINLNISNLTNSRASADSKEIDEHSLEAGLSYIGLELEQGERLIAQYWAAYTKEEAAVVSYPNNYSLRSDEERIEEGKRLAELIKTVPSLTFKKEILKQIVYVVIGTKISYEKLQEIFDQIDAAKVVIQDPETIKEHIELCLISAETVSQALGYESGETEKAKEEHAERAARIVTAQQAATYNNLDKRTETGLDVTVKDKTRGEGQ